MFKKLTGSKTLLLHLAQEQILPKTMRNHHVVILLTIVLLPFSPADNSQMAKHYGRTLLVVWEAQRARNGRWSVVLFENKVRRARTSQAAPAHQ